VYVRTCDWSKRDANLAGIRQRIKDGRSHGIVTLFAIGYDLTPWEILDITKVRAAAIKQTAKIYGIPAFMYAPFNGPPDRVRVGYLSGDFNAKPVGQLISSMFELHTRPLIFAMCFGLVAPDHSPQYNRIARTCEAYEHVAHIDTAPLAHKLNAKQLHILVDLNGCAPHRPALPCPALPCPTLPVPSALSRNGRWLPSPNSASAELVCAWSCRQLFPWPKGRPVAAGAGTAGSGPAGPRREAGTGTQPDRGRTCTPCAPPGRRHESPPRQAANAQQPKRAVPIRLVCLCAPRREPAL
jgi:hypothetical protein